MKKTLSKLITFIAIIWGTAIFSFSLALGLFALGFLLFTLSLDPNRRRGTNQFRNKYRLTK